jgi:hypothetical protein
MDAFAAGFRTETSGTRTWNDCRLRLDMQASVYNLLLQDLVKLHEVVLQQSFLSVLEEILVRFLVRTHSKVYM